MKKLGDKVRTTTITPLLFCHWLMQSDDWTRLSRVKQMQCELAIGTPQLSESEKKWVKAMGYKPARGVL